MSYTDYAREMLLGLYFESEQEEALTTFGELADKYHIPSRSDWVQMLADEWDHGYAQVYKHIGDPNTWRVQISAAGMRQVEESYDKLLQRRRQQLAKPLAPETQLQAYQELYQQIIPASDRYVTPQHNSQAFTEALSQLDEARSLIRTSNLLEPQEREDTVAHLEAGLTILQKCNSFAVGAIRYLVLDRLKKAFEGIIEDAFKAVIVTAFGAVAVLLIAAL